MTTDYCFDGFCRECRAPFYNGEEVFTWELGCVCADCFDALFDELNRRDRARLIGSRVIEYRRSNRPPV